MTDHIDIRENFIRECVYKGSTELEKLRYKNNSSYIMKKIYQWKLSNKMEKNF